MWVIVDMKVRFNAFTPAVMEGGVEKTARRDRWRWIPVRLEDRISLPPYLPVVKKVSVNINSLDVPTTWMNPNLARMSNLNLRLSPKKFRPHPELFPSLFIKMGTSDVSKTAANQSPRLAKDVARFPESAQLMIPIPLPVFPLGSIPLVDMINGRSNGRVNKYYPGGVGNTIVVTMELATDAELEQYISHLGITNDTDEAALQQSFSVINYMGFVEVKSAFFTKKR